MPNKNRFPLLIIVLLFYVGSYYLMVGKQEKPVSELWRLHAGPSSSTSYSRGSKPRYLWNTSLMQAAFTPIHWVDRSIRSTYWGPDEVIWEEPDLSQFELH